MEAAKWTFSSEELQNIVSQAIRQSGHASSIRLLSQQAAFVEAPEELERLNAMLHELRVQYRLQVRKRDALLRATYAYAESPEFSSVALRSKLQELHETVLDLDRIADELYHVRDQAAQLSRMLAVHSSSALAMALRKLHSSYLKRKAELQSLRDHVHDLETERDEAWTQAQQVARDLDDLNDTLEAHDPSPAATRASSRRSSRVNASRKSYQNMSRAGLRLSRSSMAASQMSCSSAVCSPSSAASPIPPVPPIPHRPPSLNRIITSGLPSQSSGKHRPLPPFFFSHAFFWLQTD
jgi:chromosome segregation ATPase